MNKKTVQIVMIIILIFLLLTTCFLTFLLFKKEPTQNVSQITNTEPKIISRVMVKTWNDKGIVVTMDSDSQFANLDVQIPLSQLKEKYHVGDYLNIIYNGNIIDGPIAEFQKIYDIDIYTTEIQSLYGDWDTNNMLDVNDEYFVKNIWPAILNSYGGAPETIEAQYVLGKSLSYNPIYPVACIIDHGNNRTEWKIFYVREVDEKFSVIFSQPILLNLDQLQ